ncbi:hypothetical protein [Streptomyces uncialis]|uniref:hypothetical protein n=1 Tax=Streptomyces uncialis TaxID=1048205 RepID=UPI00386C43C0|nr:hypothetical protein OG268_04495 [Streptomyces uncialis]
MSDSTPVGSWTALVRGGWLPLPGTAVGIRAALPFSTAGSSTRRSQLRWDQPAEERGKAVDGRSGLLDGLRLGESSRSGLGGKLGPSESQGPLGNVLGQPDRDSGGLREIPSVSEQIVQTDLEALGARGTPQGPR